MCCSSETCCSTARRRSGRHSMHRAILLSIAIQSKGWLSAAHALQRARDIRQGLRRPDRGLGQQHAVSRTWCGAITSPRLRACCAYTSYFGAFQALLWEHRVKRIVLKSASARLWPSSGEQPWSGQGPVGGVPHSGSQVHECMNLGASLHAQQFKLERKFQYISALWMLNLTASGQVARNVHTTDYSTSISIWQNWGCLLPAPFAIVARY